MNWTALLFLVAGALFAWLAIRMIRQNPKAFTKKKFSQSAYTLGLLTLMIIAVVAFLVFLLRN